MYFDVLGSSLLLETSSAIELEPSTIFKPTAIRLVSGDLRGDPGGGQKNVEKSSTR